MSQIGKIIDEKIERRAAEAFAGDMDLLIEGIKNNVLAGRLKIKAIQF
jgi:hypothetical protein